MKYFETHAHYDDKAFDEDRDDVIKKVKENDVEYIVNIGCNLNSSKESVKLSKEYEYVYATIGIHPNEISKDTVEDLLNIYNENKDNKIVAIGEIGYDFHYDKDKEKIQKKFFIEQIELADFLKLPVVIHSRDAKEITYNTLKFEKKPENNVLFHCFQPSDDLVRLVLENDYMVAFGGTITYPRNETFIEYVKKIPLKNIVLETDSPYLTPVPNRGKRNDSTNLKYICEKLAQIKELSIEEVSKKVFENSLIFYNI